jgi:capsular exopolysaccharide synthesis family protein
VIKVTTESSEPAVAQAAATTYANAYVDQRRVAATSTAEVLDVGSLPNDPVRPRPIRNAVLALGLGLLVGAGAAVLFEYLDDRLKSVKEVERNSKGKGIVGTIPEVTDWRDRAVARLATVEDPNGPAAEGYRSLRTSLQFIALRQPLRTLLVTSPVSSEGKTTTVANLAVTLARSGKRVICIDCDLRTPRLHTFFGINPAIGFTSVLLGDHPLSASLQPVPVTGAGSLRLLASGPLPPNPSELLATTRVVELLTAVRADADIVLLDAQALLPVTDAVVLAPRVEGVLLVATENVSTRRHLGQAIDELNDGGATTIGVLVNGVTGDGQQSHDRYRVSRSGDGDAADNPPARSMIR